MKQIIAQTTRKARFVVKIGKRLAQVMLIIGALLGNMTVGYAQAPTGEATQAPHRIFLPAVANTANDLTARESEQPVDVVDPSEDTSADYEAMSSAPVTETVNAASDGTTFIVSTTADTNGGACFVWSCSLRQAAEAAAADPTTHDKIVLLNATYDVAFKPIQLVNVTLVGIGGQAATIANVNINALNPHPNTLEVLSPQAGNWTDIEHVMLIALPSPHPTIGISQNGGTLTLNDVRIQRHSIGLSINQGNASVDNGVIYTNQFSGIEVHQGKLTLNRSTITSNEGGGIALFKSTADITNSAVIFNKQEGVFVNASTINLTNSTISNNDGRMASGAAGAGSSLRIGDDSTANLNFVTIAKNKVHDAGGGVYVSPYGKNTLNMRNSIVAANTEKSGQAKDCQGTIVSVGYNLIQQVTGCTITGDSVGNLTNVDPKLGGLALNGGTTKNHLPQLSSPVIDAIPGTSCPQTALDQRGITRPRDGNGDGKWGCDMGAVERKAP